jgi:acyl-CoA dehydrogenase
LGGELKRKEMLSARLGDILSELYFLSGALKRWEDEGRQDADFPLLQWCMDSGFATIEQRFDEVFANLPNQLAGWLLRAAILPFGAKTRGPSDRVTRACAELLLHPSETRDRLVENVYVGGKDQAVGQLIDAFDRVVATQPIHDRLKTQKIRDWKIGVDKGLVTPDEIAALEAADKAVAEVIAVDDFAHDGLATEVRAQARPEAVTAKRARAQSQGDDMQPPAVDLGESRTFGEVR